MGGFSTICSQVVLKCLYVARIERPGILWSVNKLARAATKWSKACAKLVALTFITHVNTGNIGMWETQHNTADKGLFQDSDFSRYLEDSKSTSGGFLSIF